MNSRRISKWFIVLLLLAALPGMTAAVAQGQEPAGKAPLPAVTEAGESAAPEAWNVVESEPNGARAAADSLVVGDVVRGKIGMVGDVDYFRFEVPYNAPDYGYFLIDVDARSIGSSLDPEICLESAAGETLACNDDTDTLDSLLLYGPRLSGSYYIRLNEFGSNAGGNQFFYELILSRPLLISANAAGLGTGTVAGIKFQAPDILSWSHLNTGGEKWVLLFDASDVGITKNIANVHHDSGSRLLVGFAANQYLPSLGQTATPFDLVRFVGSRYGPYTIGSFTGIGSFRDDGFDAASEKIDALGCAHYYPEDDDEGGRYECDTDIASTIGAFRISDATGNDEDIPCREHESLSWYMCLDGSQVAGLGVEDINALAMQGNSAHVYMTILGAGNIDGHSVTQKDIIQLRMWPRPATWTALAWHGPDHRWNYNIDAIEWTE